jgi:hypothetical protein
MQLSSLKATITAMLDQSGGSGAYERQAALAHTCQILALLLDAPGESGPGWPRAALALLRPQIEEPIDPRMAASLRMSASRPFSRALGQRAAPAPTLAELQERLLTVLLLPEITHLDSLKDMQVPIEQAISAGAPAYNHGDIAGCARLYLAAALALTHAQGTRGFPGQAKAHDALKRAISDAQAQADADERAWTLRHAFDRVLKL